jgi:glycosyltransferase involved in cell wall biosynthesis
MSNTKVLLHSGALSLRGDSTNAEFISTYLKYFYEIDSVITAPRNSVNNSNLRIADLENAGLNVELYDDLGHLRRIASSQSVSHAYFMTDGRYSNIWIPDVKHLVHAVFNSFEPHGDVYAYVSPWLYRKAIKNQRCRDKSQIEAERAITQSPYGLSDSTKVTWVPHSVVAKQGNGARFRSKFAISNNLKIVGRIGGFDQFNDAAAISGISRVLNKRDDIKFVFVNTRKFMHHPQILYLDSLNDADKWDFYDAGDLFLNGRAMGESFGFSIVEPLSVGKPVIAPDRLRHLSMDAAHMEILRPLSLTFFSSMDFAWKVMRIVDECPDSSSLRNSVIQFSPENSMKRFYSEFLQE